MTPAQCHHERSGTPRSRRIWPAAHAPAPARPRFLVPRSSYLVHRSRPPAFTLLEILLVLILLATLSTLTLTSFASPLRRATFDDVTARLAYIDTTTRALARTTARPVSLAFDPATNTVSRLEPDHSPAVLVRLPSSIRLTQIKTPTDPNPTQIPFTPQGLSPTYALRLDTKNAHRWLLIPGLTGAATPVPNDDDLNTLLTPLTPQ